MANATRGWGYQQVGWLLAEVERAGGSIPDRYVEPADRRAGLDECRKARLLAGRRIAAAFSWDRTHTDLSSDAAAKARRDRMASIEGQINRALAGLRDDLALQSMLAAEIGIDPETGAGLHETLIGMDRIKAALRAVNRNLSPNAPLPLDPGEAQQALLFKRLAAAYAAVMDADPVEGVTKTWNGHDGPFVAFVRAALALAGKPEMTDGAMTKAVQRHICRKDNR